MTELSDKELSKLTDHEFMNEIMQDETRYKYVNDRFISILRWAPNKVGRAEIEAEHIMRQRQVYEWQ